MVNGALTLIGGKVIFSFIDGYTPMQGEQFAPNFLASGGITGLDTVTYSVAGLQSGFQYQISGDTLIALNDGVSVTSVPEPETYALMLSGMVLVGAAARRRKG